MPARIEPKCPRCGYDQTGLLASYASQCPLGDRCTECGLDFEWTAVAHPDRLDLPWLYEHTPGKRIGVRRAWKTWARVMLPWHFWSRVRVESRVVAWRLALWVAVVFGSLQVVAASARLWHTNLFHQHWLGRAAAGMVMPEHYWATSYACAVLEPFVDIAYTRTAPPSMYMVPAWNNWPGPAKAALAPILLMGVMVLLLGASRAATKVSWRHVARATAYSLAVFVPWSALLLAQAVETLYRFLSTGTNWTGGVVPGIISEALPWAGGLTLIWFFTWWYFAIVRGFALPKGRLIWALCTGACLILAFIAVISDTRFIRDWF